VSLHELRSAGIGQGSSGADLSPGCYSCCRSAADRCRR
jgi:hypothetical protein